MAAHWGRSHQLGLPFLFVSLLLSNAFPQAPAQDNTKPSEATQATFTLRKEVNEVLVEVVVRDQNGQAVGGLKKEDFQLADNGRQQSITGFVVRSSAAAVVETVGKKPSPTSDVKSATVPAAAPNRVRHIVLYFDDIHTSAGNLRQFGLAADKFVDSLTPGDRVAVFSAETSKSLKFSSDPAELKAEIDKIRAHPLEPEANSCPRITSYEAYLIANNLNPSVYTTVLTQAVECNCGGQDGAGRAASTATWSIGTIQGCLARSGRSSQGNVESNLGSRVGAIQADTGQH